MGYSWSQHRPEAEVASGKLRGKSEETAAGTKYHAFLGVPYARPPLGELRFRAPQPVEPWTGVRDASELGSGCLQGAMPLTAPEGLTFKHIISILRHLPTLAHFLLNGRKRSEDCLFLNVFTPADTFPAREVYSEDGGQAPEPRPLRPVLFWIHGGAFKLGDSNPDMITPDLFLDKNLVVVTINYRLGPFGFLSLGTEDVPGNAGLKDQAMALRWTYDNIKAFGGDPEAITVYGESAGGASAHYLGLSPLTKGLFRGIIASSGTTGCHWACNTQNAVKCARALARQLDLPCDTPEEIAKSLRSVSGSKLLQASEKMTPVFDGATDELMFLPVVEPDLPGAFIAEDPVAMVRDGKSSSAPLMTGVNTAEGLVWVLFAASGEDKTYKAINERPHYYLPPDLRRALTPEQRDKCAREILEEYTGGAPFTKENVSAWIELYGDIMFMQRTVLITQLHASANTSPVYLYKFDFSGKYNAIKMLTRSMLGKSVPKIPGAAHGDDLWYVSSVRLLPLPSLPPDSREEVCRRRMVQLWANFVETGKPTPAGAEDNQLPVEWTPCTESTMPYLHINDTVELRTDHLFPRQAFWEGLYQRYMGKPLLVASLTASWHAVRERRPARACGPGRAAVRRPASKRRRVQAQSSMAQVRAASSAPTEHQDQPRSPCDDAEALNEDDELCPDEAGRLQDGRPAAAGPARGSGARVNAPDDRHAGYTFSLGVTLAALATATFIHYYIHQGSASAASPPSPTVFKNPLKNGLAGPFDVEMEKAEMCDKERQGLGAAQMEWSTVTPDKDVPKRYHISGSGYFNYNTSDDLAAKFLLASWNFPGRWITYYSNTFQGGCSMAKSFSPERWRRMSQVVFGHEHAECPFPPVRIEVNNFTVDHKQQSFIKEWIYGRWKVENQIMDVANGNRVVSCHRAIFRIVPKKPEKPMPAVVPAVDNTDKLSVELLAPPDAPP
ncbi:Venom carboxylesterase-6 [Frankliniella fusca]|uniref:Venom carboxylesterase-6 n=1 Tax=Frankliniella fusca TaxID=407009 RepID=A0AAE1I3Z5_9NEOP|nr:Venom carboxylesterase-6 [Frankliniella fusca]